MSHYYVFFTSYVKVNFKEVMQDKIRRDPTYEEAYHDG